MQTEQRTTPIQIMGSDQVTLVLCVNGLAIRRWHLPNAADFGWDPDDRLVLKNFHTNFELDLAKPDDATPA